MDAQTKSDLERISVATVSMQLLKRGFRNVSMRGVRPLNTPTMPIVGEAYTLRFIPGREDLSTPQILGDPDYAPRRAIEEATPGAVLVIDGRGRADIAVLGDILVERLKVRGVSGMVSDGGVRDFEETLKSELPLYAAGPAAPASVTGLAGGDLQTPIGCGGVAVFPGDAVVVDDDGAVVVPAALLSVIVPEAVEQERLEEWIMGEIGKGVPLPGLYPANAETMERYRADVAKR